MYDKLLLIVYSGIIISQSSNITICKGRNATFICVLNMQINEDDVTWYQLRKDHNSKSKISSSGNTKFSIFVVNSTISVLTIHNVSIAQAGFYWFMIKTSNFSPCNTSLTVLEGM